MGWLKNFGRAVLTGVKIASGYAPLVGGFVPAGGGVARGVDTFLRISQMIFQTEAMFANMSGTTSGAEKLRLTAPLISQVILQSDAMIGKKVKDQAKFNAAVLAITSATADLWNSVEEAPASAP